LSERAGVNHAKVRFAPGRIDVEHDGDRIAPQELVEVVRSTGYEARVSPF